MKIIFGTTNKRKTEDIMKVINENGFDLEVLTLEDIGWDLGDIEENGTTLEENSLMKAQAIFAFCQEHSISYPIITDDAGLFIEALDGRPGIYTARYADEEIKANPSLPPHECIYKVLRELEGVENRKAYYQCVVTCMQKDGSFKQTIGRTDGEIATTVTEPIKRPHFYSIFNYHGMSFRNLTEEQLKGTYRFQALKSSLEELLKKNGKLLVKKKYENSKS